MLIKQAPDIRSSEITPKSVYLRRREFIQASAAALVAAGLGCTLADEAAAQGGGLAKLPNVKKSPLSTTEAPSLYEHVTSYNNFYEFAPGAGDGPKNNSKGFKPRPWKIQVDGLVNKPGSYDIDEFMKPYALEERIYRMRCVEAWSFVIPWVGIPLAEVIKRVEPTAKRSSSSSPRCTTSGRFPMQRNPDVLDWPYIEGLRLDEAKHPLTMLAVGLYGEVLPAQNGAPIRLVVPWKYGFKGAKSIVQDSLRGQAAAQHLAEDAAQRIRVLRQRESTASITRAGARRASGGSRASSPNHPHGDVQRLRRTGRRACTRAWICARIFEADRSRSDSPVSPRRLTPAAALAYGFYRLTYAGDFNALTANPGDYITDQTGHLGARLSARIALDHAAPAADGVERDHQGCGACWGCSRSSTRCLHMLTWVVFIHYFDVSFMIEDVVEAAVHHGRHGDVPDPAGAGDHVEQVLNPQARSSMGLAASSRVCGCSGRDAALLAAGESGYHGALAMGGRIRRAVRDTPLVVLSAAPRGAFNSQRPTPDAQAFPTPDFQELSKLNAWQCVWFRYNHPERLKPTYSADAGAQSSPRARSR